MNPLTRDFPRLRGLDDGLERWIGVLAPSVLFEQWETFRVVTPGRRARSARLLVSSAPSG